MSFARLSAVESQTPARYSDDPEFDRLINGLSGKLFTLTSNTSRISQQLSLLGTKRDNESVRERLNRLLEETKDGFKEMAEGMKKVKAWGDITPERRFTQEKIGKQYMTALTNFQAVQRSSLEKERQFKTVGGSSSHFRHGTTSPEITEDLSHPSHSSVPLQRQLQQQQEPALAEQSEVDYQDELIREREAEIQEIERGVSELNEIFRDLGHIVTEQGEMLNTIEANVMATRDHTAGADRELRQADNWQKSARRRACCLMIIIAVIVAIVVMAVIS